MKDDQSYGQSVICTVKDKKTADAKVKYLNDHKSDIDKVTGDFYAVSSNVN